MASQLMASSPASKNLVCTKSLFDITIPYQPLRAPQSHTERCSRRLNCKAATGMGKDKPTTAEYAFNRIWGATSRATWLLGEMVRSCDNKGGGQMDGGDADARKDEMRVQVLEFGVWTWTCRGLGANQPDKVTWSALTRYTYPGYPGLGYGF